MTARSTGEWAPSARSSSSGPTGTSGGWAMKRAVLPRLGWAAWIRNGWHR